MFSILVTNLLLRINKAEGVLSAERIFSKAGKDDSVKASNYVSDKAYNYLSVSESIRFNIRSR